MDPTDLAYLNILRSLLQAELKRNKIENEELEASVRSAATRVRNGIAYRKALKAEISNSEERLQVINDANDEIRDNIIDLKLQLENAKAERDNATKLSSTHLEEYRGVLKKFVDTWADYEAQYEQLPLAKERQRAKIDFQEAQRESKDLNERIEEKGKQKIRMSHSNWTNIRAMIVQLADMWVNREKDCKVFVDTQNEIAKIKAEMETLKLKLNALREKEADLNKEKKGKNLAKIDAIFVEPAVPMDRHQKVKLKVQKIARTPSEDSLSSFNSAMLEEMCVTFEKTVNEEMKIQKTKTQEQPKQIVVKLSNVAQPQTETGKNVKSGNVQSHCPKQPTKSSAIMQPNFPQGPTERRKDRVKSAIPAATTGLFEDGGFTVQKQQPKVLSVESQNVKIAIIKPPQEQRDENGGTAERIGLWRSDTNTNIEKMMSEESDGTPKMSTATEAIAEKRKVLPEFTPHEAEPKYKRGKPSGENRQAEISRVVEANVVAADDDDSSRNSLTRNAKGKENVIDPFASLSGLFSPNAVGIFEDSSTNGVDTNSVGDSLLNLKISDCTLISRFPDENAVDNFDTCGECIAQRDEVNKDGSDEAMEFNFSVNAKKGGNQNAMLF